MMEKGSEQYKKSIKEISSNYQKLDFEQKHTEELKKQTALLKRISDNVAFFFWVTILALSFYTISAMYFYNKTSKLMNDLL